MTERVSTPLNIAHQRHERHWNQNVYCYPVISRRSGGLSIGVNLNPDKACNFDCIYCQVDRSTPATVTKVDLEVLKAELLGLVDAALDGSLFETAPFDAVEPVARRICDIAFSGDGEPTTYPRFDEAVQVAVDVKKERGLDAVKIVVITDASYLTKPKVREALALLDKNNGEVWAKLDAGTDEYFQLVDRPNFPLSHVLANILDAARLRPIVIQSLWMRVHNESPPEQEVLAFCERLREIVASGGQIKLVQVYTIARQTAEAYATVLPLAQLEHIADVVRATTALPVESYPGVDA